MVTCTCKSMMLAIFNSSGHVHVYLFESNSLTHFFLVLDSSALVGTLIKHGATVDVKNQVHLSMSANKYLLYSIFYIKDFFYF